MQNIFSSYLYRKVLDINLKPIHEHINQTQKKDKAGRILTNYGGWQSQSFTTPHNPMKPLFKSIDLMVEEVRDNLDCKYKLKLNAYWYSINYFGSFNKPHCHVGNAWDALVSGVFYINSFPQSGNIIFKTPNSLTDLMYADRVNSYNPYTSSTFSIEPQENLCAVFPSDLEHYVEPNLNKKMDGSSGERISISFDYGVSND